MSVVSSLSWQKSSKSGTNGDCVEWAFSSDSTQVYVRNSIAPELATLVFTASEWRAFVLGVRDGDGDV